LVEARAPIFSRFFSSDRKRRSISPTSAEMARVYLDEPDMKVSFWGMELCDEATLHRRHWFRQKHEGRAGERPSGKRQKFRAFRHNLLESLKKPLIRR
jgi:hypothetical protein